MGTLALIGLGSNLGDRRATLVRAIAELAASPGVSVTQVSAFHETEPVGGPPGQGLYLNAAASLETTLEPLELLKLLQEIEARNGRTREIRWGERTLDLDLLFYDDLIMETSELTIPHPRMAGRRFVLEPLAEIVPEAVDPMSGWTVAMMLEDLNRESRDGPERDR
ncbi:MAG: 2-amino-4-hydroxy-6-hydroxymethyldihydropteridine diphosphokinase [Isosphaeraceae bacterium]